jgi:hypothetical protein
MIYGLRNACNSMEIDTCYQQFEKWFSSKQGSHVQTELNSILEEIDWHLWSSRFLQIGSCGQNPWQQWLPFQQNIILSPYQSAAVDVVSHPLHLPFATQSIDVLFSPFTLDLGLELMPLLYEYDRVLKSMGLIIFVGVNRLGLWKLSKHLKWCRAKNWYQFNSGTSYWRLRQLMHGLGYQHYASEFFYYIPPVQSQKVINYFEWVNRVAKFIAPYPPSFYYLIMQKQEPKLSNTFVYVKN